MKYRFLIIKIFIRVTKSAIQKDIICDLKMYNYLVKRRYYCITDLELGHCEPGTFKCHKRLYYDSMVPLPT